MKRAIVAVLDAAQARLFAFDEEAPDQLREIEDLRSAGRKLRVGETTSSSEPGHAAASDGASGGYARSATDDHRDAHEAEMDTKFARDVVQALDRLIQQDNHRSLILAAGPKVLGELRRCDGVLHRADVEVHEISKILTTLTVAQLHDHLAAMDLIAPRRRLAVAR
jgi:protein required for attachment to host cells